MSCSAPSPLISVSLDDLSFGRRQNRIHFAVNVTAFADENRPSFRAFQNAACTLHREDSHARIWGAPGTCCDCRLRRGTPPA